MVGVAPGFPMVEAPEGWTHTFSGPRLWLVPPTPGGRIVVAPLQGRPAWLAPDVFLERVLVQERTRFPRMKQTEFVPVTSKHHVPGLVVDVAALDAADQPTEWRTYALFVTPVLYALMFLQSAPERFSELRPIFLTVASEAAIPDWDAPAATNHVLTEDEL